MEINGVEIEDTNISGYCGYCAYQAYREKYSDSKLDTTQIAPVETEQVTSAEETITVKGLPESPDKSPKIYADDVEQILLKGFIHDFHGDPGGIEFGHGGHHGIRGAVVQQPG